MSAFVTTTAPIIPLKKGLSRTTSPASPYHRTSEDPMFNVRRKSHVYRKRIKTLIQSAKSLAGINVGKLDAARRGAVHFFADTIIFESKNRS